MAKRNSGLGRGLDSLFLSSEQQISDASASNIKLSDIDVDPGQPRKTFEDQSLEQLSQSIIEHGVLQPIVLMPNGLGRYTIIAGERRFRAARMAGLTEIPCIILDKSDRDVAQIALIENIQREDLNPIEEALGYRSLANEYNMTQEEISEKVGKSRSAVANAMRLLDLPEPIINMVAVGELSAGHARTLLGVKDPDDMLLLAQLASEQEFSVRRLEDEVKRIHKPKKEKTPSSEEDDSVNFVDYFHEMELKIQRQLGRKAKIVDKGKKKTLTLFYEDNEDLDDLLKIICGSDFLDEV